MDLTPWILKDDWESWIIYMLNAVANTSQWTCNKIKNIICLMEETVAYVKNKQPKIFKGISRTTFCTTLL